MNACINCGECLDTGCLCPENAAKVTRIKSVTPHEVGNIQLPEVELEPLSGWEMAMVWALALLTGMCGITYFYQQIFGA